MTSFDDELDREIRTALSIEPSADFVPRIRRRRDQRASRSAAGAVATVVALSGVAAALAMAVMLMPSSATPRVVILPTAAHQSSAADQRPQPATPATARPVSAHRRQTAAASARDTGNAARPDAATQALDQYLRRLYGPSVAWMKFPSWQTAPEISPASIAIKVDPLEIEALDKTAQ